MLLTLIYFILILGLIVLVHEFGHFFFAKLFKIYVYEFAIGMGPKIFSWKGKSETLYSIRAMPIGGFCSLAGEDTEYDEQENIPKEKRLNAKPVWQRFLVMVFGAGNNFLLALLLLFIIGLGWGATTNDAIVSELVEDYPAIKAGMKVGDRILKVNKNKVKTSDDVALFLQMEDKSKPITFTIKRDNKEIEIEVMPVLEKTEDEDTNIYKIGVVSSGKTEYGFIASIKYAFNRVGAFYRQMILTLKGLFGGGLSVKQLSGPVGIYTIVGKTAESGFVNVLYLIALLSVNVGFINLLPFPAFDGGRVLFLIIEKIKGSPVNPEIENKVHTVGFILLMLLMIYVTFNDIIRIF